MKILEYVGLGTVLYYIYSYYSYDHYYRFDNNITQKDIEMIRTVLEDESIIDIYIHNKSN